MFSLFKVQTLMIWVQHDQVVQQRLQLINMTIMIKYNVLAETTILFIIMFQTQKIMVKTKLHQVIVSIC